MKTRASIFCFLCVVLILVSLYHLYSYDTCTNKNHELRVKLQQNENINDNLYQKYADVERQHRILKQISANKLHKEREISSENERHAIAMTNVIPVQYNKLLSATNTPTPIPLKNQHIQLQLLKQAGRQQQEESQPRRLLLPNPGKVDRDHALLVPGEEEGNYHPYEFGQKNDSIFGIFSLKDELINNAQDERVFMDINDNTVYYGGSGGSGNTGGVGRSGHYQLEPFYDSITDVSQCDCSKYYPSNNTPGITPGTTPSITPGTTPSITPGTTPSSNPGTGSAKIEGFWLGQSPIPTTVSFSASEAANKWMLSFPGKVLSDTSLKTLAGVASVPECEQPAYKKYILTQGGGPTHWNKAIYDQLASQAATSTSDWDGICYDWEYLDPSESWADHVTNFNKMTAATKKAGLLCIITSLGMGPAPAYQPDPLPDPGADLSGVNWGNIDYFVPQLYYMPPNQNYGFTAADTNADPKAPDWMKKQADQMNIDYMVKWWAKGGKNGHNINIKSPGYSKIIWGLWTEQKDAFYKRPYTTEEFAQGYIEWVYHGKTWNKNGFRNKNPKCGAQGS